MLHAVLTTVPPPASQWTRQSPTLFFGVSFSPTPGLEQAHLQQGIVFILLNRLQDEESRSLGLIRQDNLIQIREISLVEAGTRNGSESFRFSRV